MKKSYLKIGVMSFAMALAGSAFANPKTKPPKNIIAMATARKTATTSLPGDIQSEKLELEHGNWVYSFELKSKSDAKVHEVEVDAISGQLITTSGETDDEQEEAH